MSSKRESMWDLRSVRRELLIKMPISAVSMVGTVAKATDKIWRGLMSMLSLTKVAESANSAHTRGIPKALGTAANSILTGKIPATVAEPSVLGI
jgi:hypothetical protein